MDYDELIRKIKEKKELRGVADSFVGKLLPKQLPERKRQVRQLIKDVRSELRRSVGSYNLRSSHISLDERQESYDKLNSIIASLKPRSILDIGCGLNPIKIARPGITYYACDIDDIIISKVNAFFAKERINGKAWTEDILKAESFPQADLCLVLKVVDLMDKKGHKNAESLLKKISSRTIIISFSTKTLSGKPMNHPQRGWIERLLTRLNFSYTLVKTKNEIFYIAKK